MLGGFNKIMRNIVAGAQDTEFEKVPRSLIPVAFDQVHVPPGQQGAEREARNL